MGDAPSKTNHETAWPETRAATSRLRKLLRAHLAQVFLGWALAMDVYTVIDTVRLGLSDGAARRQDGQARSPGMTQDNPAAVRKSEHPRSPDEFDGDD